MLNLGVVWDDRTYSPEAIDIMRDMIGRNLPEETEGQFFCFSDFPDDLSPWVQKRPLNADRSGVYMVPLNSIIIRKLDGLLNGQQIKSTFFDGSFPADASVVVFPNSRPQDHLDSWVKNVWKIGGGSSAEITVTPNASKERFMDNIRYSFRKAREWFEPEMPHEGTALIIGGGPSLNTEIPLIKDMAKTSTIFAVNAVPGHIYKHDIRTDIHVMLDADPLCETFVMPGYPVKRYYASQCDPSVILLAASTGSLVCWHGGGEAADDLAKQGYCFVNVVGGGSTAASRALILAYGLGYRKFHLFGMDSSHADGKGHAYDQFSTEATLTVTCGDEVFQTSPQLLAQTEDFKLIFPNLIKAACEVTVHGDGLLTAVAAQMAA